MNERDIELARQIDPVAWVALHQDDMDWVQQFADLIRADERKACLKLCKEHFYSYQVCEAIRARGNT
jgi:hypothetical protein